MSDAPLAFTISQGEIYFCDNDSVVKLRDADFDVRNLRLEDDRIVLSSGSRRGRDRSR